MKIARIEANEIRGESKLAFHSFTESGTKLELSFEWGGDKDFNIISVAARRN